MRNKDIIPPSKRKRISKLKTLLTVESKKFRRACASFNRVKKARDGGHHNGYDSPEANAHLWFYTLTKRDCERAIRRLQSKLNYEMLVGNVQ